MSADEQPPYDVYNRNCPARMFFTRLADKWSLLIIRRLKTDAVRFNQLRRDLDGVSAKMLTQTLRNLERDGLIQRQIFATVPVTVEYSLTGLGLTLADTIDELALWAENHIETVLEAQQQFDREQG